MLCMLTLCMLVYRLSVPVLSGASMRGAVWVWRRRARQLAAASFDRAGDMTIAAAMHYTLLDGTSVPDRS